MAEGSVNSRHAASADEKISLGPVLAVNPKFVESIEIVEYDENSWLNVLSLGDVELSTELEALEYCESVLAEFVRSNPGIQVIRTKIPT